MPRTPRRDVRNADLIGLWRLRHNTVSSLLNSLLAGNFMTAQLLSVIWQNEPKEVQSISSRHYASTLKI